MSTTVAQPVFSVDLNMVMTYQKMVCPTLSIPLLLLQIRDSLLKFGGDKTEGIFRLSAKQEEVDCYKLRFNKGDYSIFKECSCHTLASLFKLFLRELPNPVIPSKFYDNFVNEDVVEQFEKDPDSILKALEILPAVNKSTVIFIINFLQTVSRNESESKMGVDNLSIIFSACMLVSNDLDPFMALTKTNLAKACIAAMIEGLPQSAINMVNLSYNDYDHNGLLLLDEDPVVQFIEEKQKKKEIKVEAKKGIFRTRDKTVSRPEKLHLKTSSEIPKSVTLLTASASSLLGDHKRVTSGEFKTQSARNSTSVSQMFDIVTLPDRLKLPSFLNTKVFSTTN
ncbi:Rho GTPase-activating protein, putative [Entamoeba invadens IP1]|uniref:Rho GTPase-activating protein, putative n=1 Tax=Entamoeba invadens IP1 TaxID=370355 RepID=UPI0002C3D2E2|nr:Rho GTPase-activating protein, putative [Entamoeba invadens IP1]ELP90583.1 Rho GTPase-activating protein, putative [Entamoeba invadens IP1]|eukprot:XP_004257354.1 Rho GTPase-activating protein, putative [Entamoeba invadens IP1]